MSTAIVLPTSERMSQEIQTETLAASTFIYIPSVPSDPTEEQRLKLMEISGAYDFWDRPEEDIYSSDDGQPV